MAEQAVKISEVERKRELTDPREAYEAMHELVAETESELGRIHGELDVLTQAWRALTWNDYEFDVDAWHRLMTRTVAQVETLRAHVEDETFNRRLCKTEAEREAQASKDKVVDMMLNSAKAVIRNEPGAERIVCAVKTVLSDHVEA
jgi:uncharacterized protein YukE